MLMLFKPWRSGADLKSNDETWDNAFNGHTFSSQQSKLMNFFHIRYECNDSRDDFSSKRELEGSSGMGFGHDEEEEDMDSEDYA